MRCLNSNTGLREQGDRQTLRFAVLHGTKDKKPLEEKVPEGRLELPRGCPHWILNPARLPIPPLWHPQS